MFVAVVGPLLQLKVMPAAGLEVAVRVSVVVLQFN